MRRLALAVTVLTAGLLAQRFEAPVELFTFPPQLNEISGMVESRARPGVFWVHEDSGHPPRIYALSRKGKLLGAFDLKGADGVDWEDMSIGPAGGGRHYLYLADIGDNRNDRRSVRVERVLEPAVSDDGKPKARTLHNVTSFEFEYEDGPRDAEGFFVDPVSGDFYFVTKREIDGNRLYRAQNPRPKGKNKLVRVATFRFFGATGAAISADGLQVLVRRYSSTANPFTPAATAATYWRRGSVKMGLPELLATPGTMIPLLPEEQGEAVAFASDGKGFYTTGERLRLPAAPLTFYPAK